ncbi:class I SAM-dependent methyltransferase [Sorangium sp. So ce302]|uniref:SAM-dependent methyltransferase n=1 Tax=unclassified Sorangium TaxID=2621164 RepID=UPI003F633E35
MIAPRTRAEREAAVRTPEEQREHERREVAAHYQNDPEIFSMVLDSRLAYATGIFLDPAESLEKAQERKYDWVRRELDIHPGERVLDVGCGWGSNLIYLAEHTGGSFQGVTLSDKQRQEALRRADRAGVASRVRIDLAHIEDIDLAPESLDAVLFVGSIVHMHNRERIHQKIAAALRPGGRLLISDCYFPARARGDRESSATQYIFVEALGYCRLISLAEELGMIEQAGLDVRRVEDLTSSYVHTVARWIDNVRTNRARIDARAPGFSRLLQTYMTVGRLSFARRTALEYMIVATKGGGRERLGVAPSPEPGRAP